MCNICNQLIIEQFSSSFIFYATREFETASDGSGRNSPFTSNLLEHIERPNLDVAFLIREVTYGVVEATNREQEPWSEGNIRGRGEFYLNPKEETPTDEITTVMSTTNPISNSTGQGGISRTNPTETLSPSSNSPSQPPPNLISKATGVNYTKLSQLLAEKKWKEADEETTTSMLKAAGRERLNFLNKQSVFRFPCEDLKIIDQLWRSYTNKRFGFSVQQEIYKNLGGEEEYIHAVWQEFGDRVGWRKEGNWLNYSELTFNLNAPKGHLPVARTFRNEDWDSFGNIVFSRWCEL